jgi:hypothetical protein
MGEAKRRLAVKTSVQRLNNRLREHGGCTEPTNLQLLVIDLDCVGAATRYLGDLPTALQECLAIAQQQVAAGATPAPTTVVWFGWPNGRQQVSYLAAAHDSVRTALEVALSGAAARGYGVSLTSIAAPIWQSAFSTLEPGFDELSAAVAAEVARVSSGITMVNLGEDARLITLPKMATDEQMFGTLGSVLRTLDEFAVTSDALLRQCGKVSISFDGLDDDPREVWDIPQCAQLMKEIDRHAPHWLWLTSPAQYVMWLATLVVDGKTGLNEQKQVVLELDQAAANAILLRGVLAAVDVLKFSGQDPTLDGVEAKLRRMQTTFLSGVELMHGRVVSGGHGKLPRSVPSSNI